MDFFRDIFRGAALGSAMSRSPKWPSARKEFLRKNPTCDICGKKGTLLKPNEAHHIIPVNFDKNKELDFQNLITACRRCHQFICHYDNWRSFNPIVKEMAADILYKIKNRPIK